MKSDIRMARRETNVKLDESGSMFARPLCCFSSSPAALWGLSPLQHYDRGLADIEQGKLGIMSLAEGSLIRLLSKFRLE